MSLSILLLVYSIAFVGQSIVFRRCRMSLVRQSMVLVFHSIVLFDYHMISAYLP